MNTNTIRVIVINPMLKTIEEVAMPNDFKAMKRDYIKCDTAEVLDFGEGVDAWFDEEGLLVEDWDLQGFTLFAGYQTLAGNVVLAGRDAERDLADLPAGITVALIEEMSEFIPAKKVKVPGTTLTTQNPDGSINVEHIGPKYLTYDKH